MSIKKDNREYKPIAVKILDNDLEQVLLQKDNKLFKLYKNGNMVLFGEYNEDFLAVLAAKRGYILLNDKIRKKLGKIEADKIFRIVEKNLK